VSVKGVRAKKGNVPLPDLNLFQFAAQKIDELDWPFPGPPFDQRIDLLEAHLPHGTFQGLTKARHPIAAGEVPPGFRIILVREALYFTDGLRRITQFLKP
jgi:hypothetical protein